MPKTEPRVAVIVLNYNGASYVKGCLSSLFRNSYANFEVLFVDNNSSDGSAEMAQRLFHSEPRFLLIRNRENFGFSIGNNIGIRRATAEYVIVLNNDTEVEEDFIETLVKVAESDGKIGSVGCKIVQLDGRVLYRPVYMSYGFIVRALNTQTFDKFTVNLANCGCATLFRKSVIDNIGGFDQYLWTDWEDHDLGYRINIAGFKCVYTPNTTVLHLGGGNYLGMTRERELRIFRNKILAYFKNYQIGNLLLRFPLILAFELYGKTRGRKKLLFLQGISQFFKIIKPVSLERKQTQRHRVTSDAQIFLNCRVPEKTTLWKTLKRI